MLKIPVYDELTVAPRALPGARQESIASPSMFTGPGAGLGDLGKGLSAGGADLAAVALNMQERENADKLFQAETALKDDVTKFTIDQKQKRGAAALADGGVVGQADKWFGETSQRHAGTLTNDVQRKLFAKSAAQMRSQTMQTMGEHMADQSRVSLTDSANSTIVSSINNATANANDWAIMESERSEIGKRVDVLAKINGYTPEVTQALKAEKLTILHKQMIQQLVVSNPTAAKTYFDKYKDEINGADRAEIGKFAEDATATSVGDVAAGTVWATQKPANATEPLKLADMEQAIRDQLKGNDKAIEQGLKGLKERASAYEYQKKQEGTATEAAVNNLILSGKTANEIRKSPEFLALSTKSPEDARKILTFMENQAYTTEARAAAREQRADAAESRADRQLHRATLDTTLKMSDPDVLVGMTRDQVVNLLPTLGSTSTQMLLSRWDAFTKNGTVLSEAKVDDSQFKSFAQRSGLDITPKADEDKERLVMLRNKVEAIIGNEQQVKKRPLSREEKDVVMQREIDNSVMQHNWFSRDKAVPVLALPEKEYGSAYVIVGPKGTKVALADIPASFRQKAITARQGHGLATTEKQIAELWLMRGK